MKRRICIFTGTRADYGLLKPLIKRAQDDPDIEMQLIVSGMHLSPEFGLTYKRIEQDGFKINEKLEIIMSSDTPVGISKSIGLGIISFSECVSRLNPDLVVLLGDRFEVLAFAIASTIANVPIAHLHGGESTYGLIDESIRHSITKMSLLHFVSTNEYRARVIQMGENPERVFNVGSLGVETIKTITLLSKEELENELSFRFQIKNILVAFHPVTLENNTTKEHFQNVLNALSQLEQTMIIFTKTNADTYGRVINEMIDEYVINHPGRSAAFISLGTTRFLSMMSHVDMVLGNSSSGIIEAASFKIGIVNIGDRQKGRLQAENVINCQSDTHSICNCIQKVYSREYQELLKTVINPYEGSNTSLSVLNIIKNYPLVDSIKKTFYSLPTSLILKEII